MSNLDIRSTTAFSINPPINWKK